MRDLDLDLDMSLLCAARRCGGDADGPRGGEEYEGPWRGGAEVEGVEVVSGADGGVSGKGHWLVEIEYVDCDGFLFLFLFLLRGGGGVFVQKDGPREVEFPCDFSLLLVCRRGGGGVAVGDPHDG